MPGTVASAVGVRGEAREVGGQLAAPDVAPGCPPSPARPARRSSTTPSSEASSSGRWLTSLDHQLALPGGQPGERLAEHAGSSPCASRRRRSAVLGHELHRGRSACTSPSVKTTSSSSTVAKPSARHSSRDSAVGTPASLATSCAGVPARAAEQQLARPARTRAGAGPSSAAGAGLAEFRLGRTVERRSVRATRDSGGVHDQHVDRRVPGDVERHRADDPPGQGVQAAVADDEQVGAARSLTTCCSCRPACPAPRRSRSSVAPGVDGAVARRPTVSSAGAEPTTW